ncbi:hypothetical protein [Pelosinus baikalensis]|uniref:Uncharacterized protein n=1 Tax=Pelosinus baikalensis TaxID=2892015 RepID=A0ABS8HR55_9FIRM|nr:hypothetical protein [Pelosinus baikalensis]MCC5465667.1 hypothetical protein [Pelosinus baikalensis]
MIQKKSWEITDEFWNAIKDLIPKTETVIHSYYQLDEGDKHFDDMEL